MASERTQPSEVTRLTTVRTAPDPPGVRTDASSVEVAAVGSSFVTITYETLPGNRPNANGNRVAIWQDVFIPNAAEDEGAPTPAMAAAPLAEARLPTDESAYGFGLGDLYLADASYVMAYSLGDLDFEGGRFPICAVAYLPPGGGRPWSEGTSISLFPGSLVPGSVAVVYRAVTGYRPGRFGSWIGLFEGHGVDPFSDGAAVLASIGVPGDSNQAEVVVNYPFEREGPYTLACYLGPARTTAASKLEFVAAG